MPAPKQIDTSFTDVGDTSIEIKRNDWCYMCGLRFDRVAAAWSNNKHGIPFVRICLTDLELMARMLVDDEDWRDEG